MMDGYRHDVAQKIKSAIKAKLIELDAYVDDELPDYIMVMVANKKTKATMAEDLNLFLNDNTATFTDWLQEVLDKLQSVSLEGGKTNKSKGNESESKVKSDTEAVSTSGKALGGLAAPPPLQNHTAVGDAQDDILAIDAEQEADFMLGDELKDVEESAKTATELPTSVSSLSAEYKPTTTVAVKTKPQLVRTIATPPNAAERNDTSTMQPLNLTIGCRINGTPTDPDVVQMARSISSVPAPEVCSRKRKTPSSTVGAVLQRQFPQEEEEDDVKYDPRHPLIGSVASVVQITQRRSSVPPERQANRALLLKAVNEAHKSVLSYVRSLPETCSASPQLFTKRYLSEHQLQDGPNTNKLLSRHAAHARVVDKQPVAIASRPPPQQEKQLVSRSTSPVPVEPVVEPVKEEPYELPSQDMSVDHEDCEEAVNYVFEQSENQNEPMQIESPSKPASPKFIITLDGIDAENMFANQYSDLELIARERIVHVEDTLVANDDNDDFDLELQSEHESLYSEGDDMDQMNLKEGKYVSADDDGEELSSGKRLKLTERCRFWPSCRNGDECPFKHPTVSCKAFPNCKFGLRCLYIHPNCKFDSSCTRRECPFTHTSKKMPIEQTSCQMQPAPDETPLATSTPRRPSNHLSTMSQQPPHKVPCRNFPKCNNVNCTFLHPKPCRYGVGCKRPDCIFSHPSLPNRNQLRWACQPTAQHISQREFSLS